MTMLQTKRLTRSFGGFVAVSDVSLDVPDGSRYAIIGPNGAGKSTLFNLLTGNLKPDRGTVSYRGEEITGLAPHVIVRKGISRSFQHTNVYPKLSVFENVQTALIAHHGMQYRMFSFASRLFRDEVHEILSDVGLEEDSGRFAGTLAYGRQKQLELAVALASSPNLLLLDEPTAGMSPQETRQTIELIGRIVEDRGLNLFFTEHDMDVVFGLANRISVLHLGRIIATGDPQEVRANEEVRQVYLGGGADGTA